MLFINIMGETVENLKGMVNSRLHMQDGSICIFLLSTSLNSITIAVSKGEYTMHHFWLRQELKESQNCSSGRNLSTALALNHQLSGSGFSQVTLRSLLGLSELYSEGQTYHKILGLVNAVDTVLLSALSLLWLWYLESIRRGVSGCALWEWLYTGHHCTVCTLTHVCSVSHTLSSVSHG